MALRRFTKVPLENIIVLLQLLLSSLILAMRIQRANSQRKILEQIMKLNKSIELIIEKTDIPAKKPSASS